MYTPDDGRLVNASRCDLPRRASGVARAGRATIRGRLQQAEHRANPPVAGRGRYFVWIVGVQVTTLAAIVAALAARP
jgi:hypothetical protein